MYGLDIAHRGLRALFESSPVPLTLAAPLQPGCPLLACNAPFLDLTGYDVSDVLGRNCRFLQGPGSEHSSRTALRKAVENGRDDVADLVNYRRDGTAFRNFIFLLPIFDMRGRHVYVLGSQHAIGAADNELTLVEHAQWLDERVVEARSALASRDQLLVRVSRPCVDAIRRA